MPFNLDDYEPVEDRLRAFWSEHPNGRVLTFLVQGGRDPGDVLVFKALVQRDARTPIDVSTSDGRREHVAGEGVGDMVPDATGYAHQRILAEPPKKRNGEPNYDSPEWSSPFEVAETSAIGRALANLGYAAKGKRPSREEMTKTSAAGPSSGSTPAADSGSGGEVGAGTAPPARTYPFDQDRCKHKDNRGRTHHSIGEDGVDRCELCGMPWVSAVEGTLDDIRRG